ncbi:MAG: SWIM zinc finger family protein [Chloroflexi bacterium]|nr:SWIM zinc finger family protein [Chloroflexota bacterium]
MYSSVIGKIEKARRYAEEKGRVNFDSFIARFRGEHDSYQVEYKEGTWGCSCQFFAGHGFCSHSMALQRMLEDMLSPAEVPQA